MSTQGRRKSFVTILIAGISVMLGMGTIIAMVAFWTRSPEEVPEPRILHENADQRRQELQDALVEQKPLSDDELAAELKAFFDLLEARFRSKNGKEIAELIDINRMMAGVDLTGFIDPGDEKQQRAFLDGARVGLPVAMARTAEVFQFQSTTIRHVETLPGGEVRVIAIHEMGNGLVAKMRWWLIHNPQGWQLYDYEDLDTSMRASSVMSTLMSSLSLSATGKARLRIMQRKGVVLHRAIAALLRQDFQGLRSALDGFDPVGAFPSQIAVYWMLRASLALTDGDPEAVLGHCDRANESNPDMPVLAILRGAALTGLGRFDEASAQIEKYRQLLGDDADVCFHLGQIALYQNRPEDAAKQFRRSLDFHPEGIDSFVGLLYSLNDEANADDLGDRFAQLGPARVAFDAAAQYCVEEQDARALERLAALAREWEPKYASVDYHDALAKTWMGKIDASIPLFRSAIELERNPATKQAYRETFLSWMADSHRGMQAYRELPDRRATFRFLAAHLLRQYQFDQLLDLIELHSRIESDDSLIPLYRGFCLAQEYDYDRADEQFRLGMRNPPDDAALMLRLRRSRILARAHTAGAAAAYREIAPEAETVRTLAYTLLNEEKFVELEELLQAHEKADGEEGVAEQYRIMALIRREKVDEACALFSKAEAEIEDSDVLTQFRNAFAYAMAAANEHLKAYQSMSDKQAAFELLASEIHEMESWDLLPALLKAHEANHPDDLWLTYYRAMALEADEKHKEAATLLLSGWKDADEENQDSFFYPLISSMARSGRALEAYDLSEEKETAFWHASYLLMSADRWEDLQELIERHRPNVIDKARFTFLEAEVAAATGHPNDAIELMRQGWDQIVDPTRASGQAMSVLGRLYAAGHCMMAYRSAPDQVAAFETLANRLRMNNKWDELQTLVDEHRRAHESDKQLAFYEGALALARGELDVAERHFRQGFTENEPRNTWQIRTFLFEIGVKTQRTTEFFREYRTEPGVFEALARTCLEEKAPRQLEKLIEARERERSDDPALEHWRVCVAWLDGEYDKVIEMIRQDPTGVLAREGYLQDNTTLLIRSLVRSDRAEEAACEWDATRLSYDGERMGLLTNAVLGDVAGSIEAMKTYGNSEYTRRAIYDDEDLGPILKSEAFKPFRAAYPEPEQSETK